MAGGIKDLGKVGLTTGFTDSEQDRLDHLKIFAGDPNGSVTSPIGTLCLDTNGPNIWQNIEGASAWEQFDVDFGDGLNVTSSVGSNRLVEVLPEDSTVQVGPSGIKTSRFKTVHNNITPVATSGDQQDTGITLSSVPVVDSNVLVFLDGVLIDLGVNSTSNIFYFSADSGVTGKAFNDLTIGDSLYFNGLVAGFDLDTNDKIDIIFESI